MTRLAAICRRIETALIWTAAIVAWCAFLCGQFGPRLGGPGPGLQGPAGFVVELVAAMWLQGGVLTALVTVVALLRRRWLPAAALAMVALLMLVPELLAWPRSASLQAREGRPCARVATANLAEQNERDPDMLATLRELDADVLVLCEYTGSWAARLQPLEAAYAYRWLAAPPVTPGLDTEGLRIAVWSRLPAAGDPEVLLLGGLNAQLCVPLRFADRTFKLFAIHAGKPYPYGVFRRSWRQHQQLLDWIRRERSPMVVAGDFNASPRSAFVQQLRLAGMTNASEVVCGRAPVTWPMQPTHLAMFRVAIDHVMCSDAFAALGFRRAPATNSDHAAVVAELAWCGG
jgi:endonuclease/exonuclease/phosphatase (EEP) superfamily protein YafD